MNLLSSTLLLTGCIFLLLAAIGIVRMPDLYLRMSTSSKAVTLGVGCLALGLATDLRDSGVTTRALLLIVLFLMKAPVAAHVLGRAAYMTGVPLWKSTGVDEMAASGLRKGRGGATSSAPGIAQKPDALEEGNDGRTEQWSNGGDRDH